MQTAVVGRGGNWYAGLAMAVLAPLGAASPAVAQDAVPQEDRDKRWGLTVSVAPKWTANGDLLTGLHWTEDAIAFEGSEIMFGVARESPSGGGWSVSYVRKPFKDLTAVSTRVDEFCFAPGECVTTTSEVTAESRNVLVHGVEANFFLPFVKVRDRFKAGVNLGVGAGFPSGTVAYTYNDTTVVTSPGRPPETFTDTSGYEEDVSESTLFRVLTLAKAEAQASVHVGGGLRVIVAAGLNMPSAFTARFGVTYLFGPS